MSTNARWARRHMKTASNSPASSRDLADLQRKMADHELWSNRLFVACKQGRLALDDFRVLFGQYSAYSRNFTRYLAGVMTSCPDDYLRSRLSENLWEEGGGAEPEQRHAQIFRNFLASIEVDASRIELEDCTRLFVDRYLAATRSEDHVYAAAFLALGTEGIVSRMYQVLVDGMRLAGIPDQDLHFFHLHIGCDDEHAETLMMILEAQRSAPDWYERALRGMNDALEARRSFFEAIYSRLEERRYRPLIERVRGRQPLVPPGTPPSEFLSRAADYLGLVYANKNERLNIEFTVERVRTPGAQVLDPRVVRIPVGRNNERHRHAHETLFYIVSGSAEVLIGEETVLARAGDTVFVPRWAFHQSRNIGTSELVILAVTDFGLTSAVLGDYDKATRLKAEGADAAAPLSTVVMLRPSREPPPPRGPLAS